jgi:hypothetical protein
VNGPVPTGFWFISFILPSACSLSAYSLETIEAKGIATLARKGASLRFSVNFTVRSSTFSIDCSRSGKPMPEKYSQVPPSTYLFHGLSAFHWRS